MNLPTEPLAKGRGRRNGGKGRLCTQVSSSTISKLGIWIFPCDYAQPNFNSPFSLTDPNGGNLYHIARGNGQWEPVQTTIHSINFEIILKGFPLKTLSRFVVGVRQFVVDRVLSKIQIVKSVRHDVTIGKQSETNPRKFSTPNYIITYQIIDNELIVMIIDCVWIV